MSITNKLLESVQLKKVEPPADNPQRSKPIAIHAEPTIEEESKVRTYFFASALDEWYDSLKNHTFPSKFTKLTVEEGKKIVDAYSERIQSLSNFSAKLLNENGDVEELPDIIIPSELNGLIARIQNVMDKEFAGSDRFFIKLSTRSPKDANIIFRRAAKAYIQTIRDNRKNGIELDENARWIALTEEVAKASVVKNALEAVQLLLDSERVYEDIKYALENEQDWSLTIVIRAWDERVKLQSEFRGFCWNRRLTCMGQYFHPLYFPELIPLRDQIAEDCQALFNQIKDSLPVPNALVDFAWLGPNEVLLIEVNPLCDGLGSFSASTGLFDYEKDQALIQGFDVNAPFELRLREAPEDTATMKLKSRTEWKTLVYSKGTN